MFLASLAKWLSFCLQIKWLQVRIPLLSLNQLAFININAMKHGESFITGICRKSTFSGFYTNYNSLIPSDPSEYKTGLVTTLLERCFQIASSYEVFHKEIEKTENYHDQKCLS